MSEPGFNQYAAPRAEVADVSDNSTAELRMFSAQGRIGRLRYMAYSIGAQMIYSAAVGALAAGGRSAPTLLSMLLWLPLFWFAIITGIKRCHDMDISGWWTLSVVIPVIGLAWVLYPGTQGENRFGPPPPPNTTGVRVLGAILPVIFFAGIVAAVAIPQYARYTQAHAAQHPAQN